MVRIRISRILFGLGLVLMPLSYAIKNMFGLFGVTWINPTLVIGLIVFVLLGAPLPDKVAFAFALCVFVSAVIGQFLLPVSFERGREASSVIYVEPIRLGLNIVWFSLCVFFLRLDRRFVLRWTVVAVILEAIAAAYVYLVLEGVTGAPAPVALYLDFFKMRQTVWLGDHAIYRMAGTFDESPLFALFVFSCLVPLLLELLFTRNSRSLERRWAVLGVTLTFIMALLALCDQVLIALLLFGITAFLTTNAQQMSTRKVCVAKERTGLRVLRICIVLLALIAIAGYAGSRVVGKMYEIAASASEGDTRGQSGAERWFHIRYALGILGEQPASVVLGIGPGRYGDYVGRTGLYQSTVTPGVVPIEWLVEYGLVGVLILSIWLGRICVRASRSYGLLGFVSFIALLTANAFQGVWKWEAWFLALAFLYVSGDSLSSPAVLLQSGHDLAQPPNG